MKLMWFRLIILNLVRTVLLKYLTCYVALGIQWCVLSWKANRVHFVTKRHSFLQLKNCNVMLQVLHWKSTLFVKANNLKLSLDRSSSCAWVSTYSNFLIHFQLHWKCPFKRSDAFWFRLINEFISRKRLSMHELTRKIKKGKKKKIWHNISNVTWWSNVTCPKLVFSHLL